MDNKAVYDEVLQLFISKDALREWMTKPFLVGDKAVATDAHCLVAVPEWTGNYDQCDKTKGVYPLTPNCFKEISLRVFNDAISKVPLIDGFDEETTETECDECGGDGEVNFKFYAKGKYHYLIGECPVCEGEGTITKIKEIPNGQKVLDTLKHIMIGEALFGVPNVQKLIMVAEMLNEKMITLTYQLGERSSSLFKISECEILVMPVIAPGIDIAAHINIRSNKPIN